LSENLRPDATWLPQIRERAEQYAQMRLRYELWVQKGFRKRSKVKYVLAVSFLKLYYVISAPVVTIVARSDRLMTLARLLNLPTKRVVRKILG
jgi:hypothetical protein